MMNLKNLCNATLAGILFISCQNKNQNPDESTLDVFSRINQEISNNSQAYQTLEESSKTLGHRLTGSENGSKVEEYAFQKFKEYGFTDVEFQEFEVNAWSRGEVLLRIKSDDTVKNVPVVSLGHSPVSASLESQIVDVGNGLEQDYINRQDELLGKIALVYIGILPGSPQGSQNLHRSEKAALAIQYGASGIIIINQVDGGVLLTGTASVTGDLLPIPAVCIGKEDGIYLKERLKTETLVAKLDMTNYSRLIKARNVIATLHGSEFPDQEIIIGGHLDSWDLATGAIDNGIGSFAVLDMARSYLANNLQAKRTIKFVMFMGEEQGLLGSKYMVAQRLSDKTIDMVKYMVNVDMTGNPRGFNLGGREEAEYFFKEIGETIKQVDSTFEASISNRAGLHSDHQPFLLEGIPTFSMISNLDPKVYRCYHSDCDYFDLVNKEHITNTVRIGTMVLYQLANADTLPASPMDSETTRDFLIRHGLKEKLVLQKDWKWEQ